MVDLKYALARTLEEKFLPLAFNDMASPSYNKVIGAMKLQPLASSPPYTEPYQGTQINDAR